MIDKLWKKYKRHEEIINYLIAGGFTTVVSLGAKFICAATILDADVPWQNMTLSFINWIVGVIVAYITNRGFVFKSQEKNIVKEAGKFVAARIVTLPLDAVVNILLVNLLGVDYRVSTFISAVLVVIANYIFSKLFVFRKKKEPKAEVNIQE
jgi:putative flippase GtrA